MNNTVYKLYISLLFIIGVMLTIYFAYTGFDYYLTPIEERFFDPLHEIFKPSGIIGHGLGIIGSIMMLLGIFGYMIRKRVRKFGRLGILKHWLEFHIFLCSVGPILILYHTAFKFGGMVAWSFWSMVAVVASGVVGRFIYVQIPRSIQGKEFTIEDLNRQNDEYSIELRNKFNIAENILLQIDELASTNIVGNVSFLGSIWIITKNHFRNQNLLKAIKHSLMNSSISKSSLSKIIRVCKSKLVLQRRIELLKTMQRVFRYWHIIHLPFAAIMLIIMFIHVAITIIFGYKWIF